MGVTNFSQERVMLVDFNKLNEIGMGIIGGR